ncbi:unnamed protein product [Rotaria sp. Silwood1]|nr:unnamed protein product [Rotaria sp. Silwood1]
MRLNDKLFLTPFFIKFVGYKNLQPSQECQLKAPVPISFSSSVLFIPRHQLQINKIVRIHDTVLRVNKYLTSNTFYYDSVRVCHLANGTLCGKIEFID